MATKAFILVPTAKFNIGADRTPVHTNSIANFVARLEDLLNVVAL
jgi:hypothetical protein